MFPGNPLDAALDASAKSTSPLASQPPRVPPIVPSPAIPNPTGAVNPARSASVSHEEGLVVIGKGARVHGKIDNCRKLDVCGILEADVVTDMLIVRQGGGIKGTVQTDNAEIHGVVEGTLVVHEHLDIQSTGDVAGEICYQTLAIQTGARMRGNLVCQEAPRAEPARAPEPTADVISITGHQHGSNGAAVGESIWSHTSTPLG